MFLQETKTKRGGKTYISYLVRESFRTANGPRGRTICNLTHLPKEVRDLVANALRGKSLVPIDRLEVNNIHGYGGGVALEDAARRHGLPGFLAPLSPRNGALVQAMIFGGLLFPHSAASFSVESRAARLAMFCGLDPEKERFDLADLTATLRELDAQWPLVYDLLLRSPHAEVRAVAPFKVSTGPEETGAVGMDADGIPVPLPPPPEAGAAHLLEGLARQSKAGLPLLVLEEEIAARIGLQRQGKQPYLLELAPKSLAALLRQLNQAQLVESLRAGGPVEVRHHEQRHILAPAGPQRDSQVRMSSLKELTSIPAGRTNEPETPPPARPGGKPASDFFQVLATNLPAERLPAATAIEWTYRARMARAAFAPAQTLTASDEGTTPWRDHQNLQFLTHRLRCHIHAEWRACGEPRPVEEVLRDLQEVHRATLTVDGQVVRRLATHPSKGVATLLTKLNLCELFGRG